MIKLTATINKEDLRRALNLPGLYTITNVTMTGDNVVCDLSGVSAPCAPKLKVSELSDIYRIINKAMEVNKEITFEYYNEKRDAIEITNRHFLPSTWINDDCIEGFDLEKQGVRRFCPSRMNWVEG